MGLKGRAISDKLHRQGLPECLAYSYYFVLLGSITGCLSLPRTTMEEPFLMEQVGVLLVLAKLTIQDPLGMKENEKRAWAQTPEF